MTVCLMLSLVTTTGLSRTAGMLLLSIHRTAVLLTDAPLAQATAASAAGYACEPSGL